MTTMQIVVLLESMLVVALAVALIVFLVKKNKIKKADKSAACVEDGGSPRGETERDVKVVFMRRAGDIVLEKGVTYAVGEKNGVLPGKYTVVAAQEIAPAYDIKMGDVLREYKRNSDIVLKEDDIICAVSHSVILR